MNPKERIDDIYATLEVLAKTARYDGVAVQVYSTFIDDLLWAMEYLMDDSIIVTSDNEVIATIESDMARRVTKAAIEHYITEALLQEIERAQPVDE